MKTRKHKQMAFTLVELMAVMLILALIGGFAAKSYVGVINKARVNATRTRMAELSQAVKMFKIDTGRYPSEEVGLLELIEQPADVEDWPEGGYLDKTDIPKDGWKNEFDYMLNPDSGKPFVIISYGADGKEGGEEGTDDYDLYSTDAD